MASATALVSFLFIALIEVSLCCQPRDYGWGSVVCVCDAEYCDAYPGFGVAPADPSTFSVVSSNKAGMRFELTNSSKISTSVHKQEDVDFEITFSRDDKKQVITGFGGAFTDSASLHYMSLSESVRHELVRSYYNYQDGIGYTMGRVPIGGADFSWRLYTYDDVEDDVTLSNFSLTTEDIAYKIPFIHAAQFETEFFNTIKLIGSPWSAPAWMKTNNQLFGRGKLKTEYYQLWAEYFIKFLEQYANFYVDFWAVTGQNEPLDGLIPNFQFNCMGYTADEMMTFIRDNLGPTLRNSSFNNIKLLAIDDVRGSLPGWSEAILGNPDSARYVDGVAVHWYMDNTFGPSYLDDVHDQYPGMPLIYTEACEGDTPIPAAVVLGSWERGEHYGQNIMEDLNHWVTGWVDWNLALDADGGPNWAGNFVDSPIIVNATADEFYKQPMFYMMGHYSRFIPPESVILDYQVTKDDEDVQNPIEILVAQRPDGTYTSVVLNQSEMEKTIAIIDPGTDVVLQVTVTGRSISSIVWA